MVFGTFAASQTDGDGNNWYSGPKSIHRSHGVHGYNTHYPPICYQRWPSVVADCYGQAAADRLSPTMHSGTYVSYRFKFTRGVTIPTIKHFKRTMTINSSKTPKCISKNSEYPFTIGGEIRRLLLCLNIATSTSPNSHDWT